MLLVFLLKASSQCSENPSNFIKFTSREGILLSWQARIWLHLLDFCCVYKAEGQEWKMVFPHFPDAIDFIAELYKMVQATVHWHYSVVPLQFIPADLWGVQRLVFGQSCREDFCKTVSLTLVSSVYTHLSFSMWHPRDSCQKEVLCRSWNIVSRKNNEKYFPVPVYVYTVPSTSPLRFGCYIKEE